MAAARLDLGTPTRVENTEYRSVGYYGGKCGYGIGKWIAGLLPWEKHSCYIEPFAGMAGVLLARPPGKIEILNDLNGRVVNWWRVVRDQPDDFGWLIEHTPRSRAEFQWACAAVDDQELPEIRRALAFQILIGQCINAGDNSLAGGSWQRGIDPKANNLFRHRAEEIAALAERMRDVQLENIDALALLERTADCDYAVIYCDPPYPTANRSPYAIGSLDFDRLADLMSQHKGAVAVSGYPGEWDSLGWAVDEKQAIRRQIAGGGESRTEVLWRNARCVELATVRQLL